MVYVGIMNLLFLLRLGLKGKLKLQGEVYFLILAALFLFSAFRYEVGCDWSGYYFQFIGAEQQTLQEALVGREPIWWLILQGLHHFELSYPWSNVISSAIFFAGVHGLARRQPDRLAFLILLFPILIVNMPMSGIRQGAAIGLLCLAFAAFIDRKVIRFVFWTLVASGFHSSASIFLMLSPLAMGDYTRTRLFLSALLAVPGLLIMAGGGAAEMAAERYINSGVDAFGAAFRVAILAVSGLYFLAYLRGKWRTAFPDDYGLVHLGAMAMVLIGLMVPISSVIGDRLGYYLIPLQAMIFARIPYLQLKLSRQVHIAAPYLGLALVFTVWTQLSWHFQECYLPYNSWLFGFPDDLPYWN